MTPMRRGFAPRNPAICTSTLPARTASALHMRASAAACIFLLCLVGLLRPLTARAQDAEPSPVSAPPNGADISAPLRAAFTYFLALLEPDGPPIDPSRFTPRFLEQAPIEKLNEAVAQVRNRFTRLEVIDITSPAPNRISATIRHPVDESLYTLLLQIEQAEPHRIDGFSLQPAPDRLAVPRFQHWDDLDRMLTDLAHPAAFAAFTVQPDGSLARLHAFHADEPLAIAHTSALWLAGAAAEHAAADPSRWSEPIEIRAELKSFPPGELRQAPDGHTVSLAQLLLAAFAKDDNTAFDHLLAHLGRDAVEAYFLSHTSARHPHAVPFLSTMEVFRIKLGPTTDLKHRFAAADASARRELLAGEVSRARASEELHKFWRMPQENQTIGWFASADDLCRQMAELVRLASLEIHAPLGQAIRGRESVPVDHAVWGEAVFKGGGEPGVLSGVWWLRARAQSESGPLPAPIVVAVVFNRSPEPLDQAKVRSVIFAMLDWLARAP